MNKKMLLCLGGALVVLLVSGAVLYDRGMLGNPDRVLWNVVKKDQALSLLYTKAQSKEREIAKTPDKPTLYFDAGLYWKSIGEQMSGSEAARKPFFERSFQVYNRGVEQFGSKNILFYHNAGNLAKRIGDFGTAEAYYKKEIEISEADEMGYIDLAELYDFQLHKSKEEIISVYEKGISTMAEPTPLLQHRAAYLSKIGEYTLALKEYEQLLKRFPNNEAYKIVITELQAAIQK